MRIAASILLALALFACCPAQLGHHADEHASIAPRAVEETGPAPAPVARSAWTCVHIVDGDTLDAELDGVKVRIRLLGIDTPERGQPGYKEASENLRRLAQDKPLRLERPIGANGKPERDTDKYGRLLRRVYVGETDLSAAQLEAGYAHEYFGGKR